MESTKKPAPEWKYEKYLIVFRKYFFLVVILALGYGNIEQYKDNREMARQRSEDQHKAIVYWREAYRRSSEFILEYFTKQNKSMPPFEVMQPPTDTTK